MSDVAAFLDAIADEQRRADARLLAGPHSTGKGCLYLKRVGQVDEAVLREIVARSHAAAQ